MIKDQKPRLVTQGQPTEARTQFVDARGHCIHDRCSGGSEFLCQADAVPMLNALIIFGPLP